METTPRTTLVESVSRAGLLISFVTLAAVLTAHAQENNGLAPEVADLSASAVSFALEAKLPDLAQAYLSVAPTEMRDGIPVGVLGQTAGDKEAILKFAQEIDAGQHGEIDSLLIAQHGILLFESYFRRGRINYPHYQMSIAKSYTAMAIGRAIQLGYLSMADLDKPVVSFLKGIDQAKIVAGAAAITLSQAMTMSSGIQIDDAKVQELMKQPVALKGLGQIQAYLDHSATIPAPPRKFKYQSSDPAMTMQVLDAVVPGTAQEFIKKEMFGKMGITNFHWETDVSGLPKSAAGSAVRSRDMLKWGLLILAKGKWQGEQLTPAPFVDRATSPLVQSWGKTHYGYFWWSEDFKVGEKTWHCIEGRGAGGQFIFMFPELDLIAVFTAHHKGMGTMIATAPNRLVPAFIPKH